MPDDADKKWKPQLYGKAQTQFNDAALGKTKPPVQEVEKKTGDSGMVNTKPVPVPKPPGMSGQDLARQKHNAALETAHKAAQAKNLKKEVSLEDQKEIAKLNERLRQAATRERQNDRGR